MRITAAEQKVFAQIDKYLTAFKAPPNAIHIYPKQFNSVVSARRKRRRAIDTAEHLNFTSYKGVPVIVYEENRNVS